jgi:hypothetical protein
MVHIYNPSTQEKFQASLGYFTETLQGKKKRKSSPLKTNKPNNKTKTKWKMRLSCLSECLLGLCYHKAKYLRMGLQHSLSVMGQKVEKCFKAV